MDIALKILEEIKDDNPDALLDLLLSYNAMANMYIRSDAKESERLYLRAIELVSKHKFDSKYITYLKGSIEESLGNLYISMYLTDYDKAKEYYKKAFETFEKVDEGLKDIAISNKISIYHSLLSISDDLNEDIELMKRKIELIENNKHCGKFELIEAKLELVETYRQNKITEHREKYLLEVLNDLKGIKNNTSLLLACYQGLCFYYGDIEKAEPLLKYARLGLGLANSLDNQFANKEGYVKLFEMCVNIANEHMN